MTTAVAEILRQLDQAGYVDDLLQFEVLDQSISGTIALAAIARLRNDTRFAKGALHGLHEDVGEHRLDFRSYNGALGKGSLQLVIDKETGRFYCDLDDHNPYQDVVRFLGHAFGEVIPNWVKRLFRRKKGET
jgi:hypothetical protein